MKNIYKIGKYIYITSDEKIKNFDYVISDNSIAPIYIDGVVNTVSMLAENKWKSVVLTNDYKNVTHRGTIPSEVIEVLKNNPNYDFVEVHKTQNTYGKYSYSDYTITIPKEQTKQD